MPLEDARQAVLANLSTQRRADASTDNALAEIVDEAFTLELKARLEFEQAMEEVHALRELAQYGGWKEDVIEARGKRLEAGLLGDPSAGSIGLVRRVELMERKQDQRFDKLETEHRREQARLDTWIKREDTEHNVLRFLGRSILGLAGASVALFTWLVSQAQK